MMVNEAEVLAISFLLYCGRSTSQKNTVLPGQSSGVISTDFRHMALVVFAQEASWASFPEFLFHMNRDASRDSVISSPLRYTWQERMVEAVSFLKTEPLDDSTVTV
jgi:hypothetical protein